MSSENGLEMSACSRQTPEFRRRVWNHKTPMIENTAADSGKHAADHKGGWKSRITHEVRQFLRLFIYLYPMFALFLLHESVVLARYDIPFTRYGFALVTALVLAKVMLVIEELNLVRGFESRPPSTRSSTNPSRTPSYSLSSTRWKRRLVGSCGARRCGPAFPRLSAGRRREY